MTTTQYDQLHGTNASRKLANVELFLKFLDSFVSSFVRFIPNRALTSNHFWDAVNLQGKNVTVNTPTL